MNKEIDKKIERLRLAYQTMSKISLMEDQIKIKKQKAQKELVMAKEEMRDIKFDY